MNKFLTKTNGMIGALLGILLALVGVVFWVATSHHKTGLGLLVLGVILLAVGGYAYMAGGKTAQAR
jgi:cbb3-type cytochrome oxidase subunit 3